MKKFESCFVLSLRGISVGSGTTKADLDLRVKNVTRQEHEQLEIWKACSNYADISNFKEYSANDLKNRLELETNHTFPILLSMLGTKAKNLIVGYYQMKGFNTIFPETKFTEEQSQLLDLNLKGVYVVNCGPGTGKTMVANERAYRLREEGVLLISFKNATIDENYRRFHKYPGLKGLLGRKDYSKRVCITTADSLATWILQGVVENSEHDASIRMAIDKIQFDPVVFQLFNRPGQGLMYQHIICDECQDICDLRGALILNYFVRLGCKSLTLFGDPRQRIIDGAGLWFSQLWTDESTPLCHLACEVNKVAFSYSFRFQNQKLIELANHLSSRRPETHVALRRHPSVQELESPRPVVSINFRHGYDEYELKQIAVFIRDTLHFQHKVGYLDICVLTPSFDKHNKASKYTKKVYTIFQAEGVPVYTHKEGSFQPDGVVFSTLHSSKGKEWDYVFLLGMSNYPNTYSMIPYDAAESIVFVCHSRARKQIYYLSTAGKDGQFTLPRGVHESMVQTHDGQKVKQPNVIQEMTSIDLFSVTEVASDFGLDKLLKTNKYDLHVGEEVKLGTTLPPVPEGFDPRFYGVLCGMLVEMYLTQRHPEMCYKFERKEYKLITKAEYEKLKRKGLLYDGMCRGVMIITREQVNFPTEEEIHQLKIALAIPVPELELSHILILARIYDFVCESNMSNRYEIRNLDLNLIQPAKAIATELLNRFGSQVSTQFMMNNGKIIGVFDAIFHSEDEKSEIEGFVLEFKTSKLGFKRSDLLQAYLYYMLSGKIPILVNLVTGSMRPVISTVDVIQWKFIMNVYVQLRVHQDLVQHRKNLLINQGKVDLPAFDHNMFTVDTEFYIGYNEICDIACVNLKDIYRSVIHNVKVQSKDGLAFACSWLTRPAEAFTTAKSIQEVDRIFRDTCDLHRQRTPLLINYICPVDINWATYTRTLDLGPATRNVAKTVGTFMAGSQPPCLSTFYSFMCGSIDTVNNHIVPHQALSDALMLYELLHLGIVRIDFDAIQMIDKRTAVEKEITRVAIEKMVIVPDDDNVDHNQELCDWI